MCRADDRFVDALGSVDARLGQQVASHVFAHELIVGHVGVERADQIVAVVRGADDFRIALGAVRFGIANPVHPVAGPALAELRAGQQLVDKLLDRGAVGR